MASRPNVLLICTDHWGGPLTGSVPHPVLMTPTVNQLRRNGVTFTNAYSVCPSCIPARRTLMTGMTARSHGDRSFQERAPFPQVSTLPQCFRDEGYQTFAVGKLHVYPQRSRIGFRRCPAGGAGAATIWKAAPMTMSSFWRSRVIWAWSTQAPWPTMTS